jgi:membrane protease YdiL (CAAX protease family)
MINNEKKFAILKCLVVLFLIFLPSLYTNIITISGMERYNYIFDSSVNAQITMSHIFSWLVHSLQILIPLLVIILISKEAFKDYGFSKPGIKVFFIGQARILLVFLCFLFILGIALVVVLLKNSGLMEELVEKTAGLRLGQHTNSGAMILLSVIPLLLSALMEELCFRSYLYKNINKLISNKWVCVSISCLLFSALHIYQGIFGAIGAFILGFALSIEFKKSNNIYIVTVFHFLKNISAFLLT